MFNKTIFMVCYGGGHVRIIEPLYQKLKDNNDVIILALTSAQQYLADKGIPYLSFSDYAHLLTKDAKDLARNAMLDMSYDNENETLAYMGFNLIELKDKYGSAEADALYKKNGRSCFFPYKFMQHVIKNINPDIVITTTAPRAERAALKVARELGIRSLCIADNVFPKAGSLGVAEKNYADAICVLCNELKVELVRLTDIDPRKIFVTGTPPFDILQTSHNIKSKRNRLCIALADCNLPESDPRYPNSKSRIGFDKDIRLELDNLALKNGWKVTFRPHPNQSIDYRDYNNVGFSEPGEPIIDFLNEQDIIITAHSTVGLEGLAVGCGLVSLEDTVFSEAGSYAGLGLSTGCNEHKHLEEKILLEFNKIRSSKYFYSGNSVDNIMDVAETILLNKKY